MNCCHGNNQNHDPNQGRQKGMMSHLLMMLLCCGAPALLLLLVPVIGSKLPGVSTLIASIAPFLCPIMMVLMMGMMFRKNKGSNDSN